MIRSLLRRVPPKNGTSAYRSSFYRASGTGTEKELSVLLFDTSSFDVLALDAAIGEAVGLATGADVGEGLALHQILRKRERLDRS